MPERIVAELECLPILSAVKGDGPGTRRRGRRFRTSGQAETSCKLPAADEAPAYMFCSQHDVRLFLR